MLEARADHLDQPLDQFEDDCITRAAWVVDVEKARAFPYVLAVHRGVVQEVYRVAALLPAGSTLELNRSRRHPPERFEFVGRIAEEPARSRYRLKSVAHLFRPGNQSPVRYFSSDR